MKNKNYLVLLLVVVLNMSCYTYKVFPKEKSNLKYISKKQNAYIINDSLKKELKILKYSEIFSLTTDSFKADLKIKLYPIEQSWVCGQPLTLSLVTLGQFPVYLPDRYVFRFDEIKAGEVNEKTEELTMAKRVWFWDIFVFNKRFEEKAGKALLGSYTRP